MLRWLLGLLLLFWGFPLYAQDSASYSMVNRTFVAVEKTIYSQWDVAAILCIDKSDSKNVLPLSLAWLQGNFSQAIREENVDDFTKSYPEAARFLVLALGWEEAQNLNLFIPTDNELKAIYAAKIDFNQCDVGRLGSAAIAYLSQIPEDKFKNYVDIVLRGRAYQKVRKAWPKNVKWYWHTITQPIGSAPWQR